MVNWLVKQGFWARDLSRGFAMICEQFLVFYVIQGQYVRLD